MQLHTIGIDLGTRRGCGTQEVFPQATAALHSEPAGGIDWHGSLWRVPLSRAGSERAGLRSAADAGSVCQTLCSIADRGDDGSRRHGSDARNQLSKKGEGFPRGSESSRANIALGASKRI